MAKLLKKISRFLTDKRSRFEFLKEKGFYRMIPDKAFLKKAFRVYLNAPLDLSCPVTFNEKLQWLKLYDRRPEYTSMVDKYGVKQFVSDCIGEEYIIPTLGVWETFDEIDFDSLPEQFVLKCTHDCGGLVICRDKSKLDLEKAKKKINSCLTRCYYYDHREWPYKNVKPRIIAEAYMEDSVTAELRDYKFFCFNGEARLLFVATERQKVGEEVKFDFFDMEYHHLELRNGHPNASVTPEKPSQFELMKQLAGRLSQGIPHVRVDFYEVNGKVYFGEMTFFHFSGFVPFEPDEWDSRLGEWIILPPKTV